MKRWSMKKIKGKKAFPLRRMWRRNFKKQFPKKRDRRMKIQSF